MPQLVVLNGPPGIGKSTLARRYVEDHPLTLCLEQDVVRGLLGGWLTRETESGALARALCLAMATTHLRAAHDVFVPQFIGLPGYLDQLARAASEAGAQYRELLLMDDPQSAERRFHSRVNDPLWAEHQRVAARFIAESGGYQFHYGRLIQCVEGRDLIKIPSVDGEIEGTYAALIAALR